jgi:ATP-binding cassette subfamily E protein 1
VLGLVGTNGIGKSTALKILANKQVPNLGKFDKPPGWEEILQVQLCLLHELRMYEL